MSHEIFSMDSVHTYGICKSVCLCEKYRIKEAVEQRLGSTGHDKTLGVLLEKYRDIENNWNSLITGSFKTC